MVRQSLTQPPLPSYPTISHFISSPSLSLPSCPFKVCAAAGSTSFWNLPKGNEMAALFLPPLFLLHSFRVPRQNKGDAEKATVASSSILVMGRHCICQKMKAAFGQRDHNYQRVVIMLSGRGRPVSSAIETHNLGKETVRDESHKRKRKVNTDNDVRCIGYGAKEIYRATTPPPCDGENHVSQWP